MPFKLLMLPFFSALKMIHIFQFHVPVNKGHFLSIPKFSNTHLWIFWDALFHSNFKKRHMYLCSNTLLINYKLMYTWLTSISCSLKYQVSFNIFKIIFKQGSYVGGHVFVLHNNFKLFRLITLSCISCFYNINLLKS